MRAIKVLCVISALFLMSTSDVSAKSANNTVIKETTNNKIKDENTSLKNADNRIKDEDESIKKTRTSIQGLGNNALQIINRPGITSSQVCAEFKTLLENNLATGKIEKRVLGKYYKQLKESDKLEFKNSLVNMLVNVYTSRFNEYKAAKFTVTNARRKSKNQIVVDSTIIVPGKKDIQIAWIVYVSDGKIYDVKIDNVSISQIQQTTISDKIAKSGFQKFLKDFTNQYHELKAN